MYLQPNIAQGHRRESVFSTKVTGRKLGPRETAEHSSRRTKTAWCHSQVHSETLVCAAASRHGDHSLLSPLCASLSHPLSPVLSLLVFPSSSFSLTCPQLSFSPVSTIDSSLFLLFSHHYILSLSFALLVSVRHLPLCLTILPLLVSFLFISFSFYPFLHSIL